MEKENNVILLKDINWFIGYTEDTKKVTAVPYIYNSDWSKIKVLTDNNVYEEQSTCVSDIIEKNYNLQCWGIVVAKSLRNALKKPLPVLYSIIDDKKVTSKKMLSIKSHLENKYQKMLNKYFKTQQKEKAIKAFQDTYKDF